MGIHSPTSKSRAFTLIELLVVVAIIAIFAAMLFPVHTNVGRDRRATCMNHQRQIGAALAAFTIEHSINYPWQLSVTNGGSMESIRDGVVFPHFRLLAEYVGPNTRFFLSGR